MEQSEKEVSQGEKTTGEGIKLPRDDTSTSNQNKQKIIS